MFTTILTRVTLTTNMLTLNVFKHSPFVFYNVITVSASPKQASISSHFFQHLHLNYGFVSISSACTLDGKTSVGVDHSAAVVVATIAVLAVVVRLVSIRVVLRGNLLLALLPGCGVLLLLRNHFSRRGDRL